VKADAEIPAYPGILADQTEWADGDSFPVIITRDGKKEEISARLYFVDCPETISRSDNDATRLRSQARYFGVEEADDVLATGKAATIRTRELLAKPFTVHTKFSNAMGRSRKKRCYVMITLHDQRDLAAVLVQEGLARAHGTSHSRPDGVKGSEYKSLLADMELGAAMRKQGIWAKSDVDKLVKMRAEVRREQYELSKFVRGGAFSAVTKENPVDINNATREELKLLHGIGDGLSHQIIINRPYKTIEDLLKVKGLGATTVNRLRPYLTISVVKKKPETTQ
jgi:competence ComEA-like helix-hairpin-helix protein